MKKYLATSSASAEIEVRKSRFLARALPVADEESARSFIRDAAVRGASHNCFAWRLDDVARVFDDGEPGGTAGRPILAAIDHYSLYHVAVVVTRWFGGIKLGTGGLARAYGNAADQCLQNVEKIEWIPRTRIRLEVSFEELGAVYSVLASCDAVRINEEYSENGLTLTVELPVHLVVDFEKSVTDATRGNARFQHLK